MKLFKILYITFCIPLVAVGLDFAKLPNGAKMIIHSFLMPSLDEYLKKIQAFKTAKEEFDVAARNAPGTYNSINDVLESKNNDTEAAQKYISTYEDLDKYWKYWRAIENKDTQYDIQYLFIKYYSSKRIDSLSFENHLDNLIKDIETLIGRIARKEPLKEDIVRPFIFKEIIGNYSYKIKSIFKQHLINPPTYSDSIFRQKEYGAQYYDWHRFEAEIQGKILAIKNADNFAEIADKLTEATDIFKTFSEQVFPVESDCMANCTGFFDNLIFYSEKNHLKEILRKIKSELDNLIDSFEMIIKKL